MKRKFLLLFLAIVGVCCLSFGLTACGILDGLGGSGGGNGGDNGGTGGIGGKTDHTHTLKYVSATDATCTEDGNRAYYECGSCGKLFLDADGTDETNVRNIVIMQTGHRYTLVNREDATCTTDGHIAYYECENCDKWFREMDNNSEITDKSTTVLQHKGHDLGLVKRTEATCTEDGNTAYYICRVTACQKWFDNEDGKNEITDKSSVVIAKKGHKPTTVEEVESTCTEEGNTAYFTCDVCEKWFEDEDCETEITDKKEVVVKKIPHNYESEICTECGFHVPTEGLQYIEYNTYCAVSGIGEVTDTEIYIAEEYSGKPVTSVANSAFNNCRNLLSVNIPDSVTSIGQNAFSGCSGLTSIAIGNGVTSIGSGAFYGCSKLLSVNIPDSVTSIGQNAFSGCSSLKTVIVDDGNQNFSSQDGILYNKAKTVFIHVPQEISGSITIPNSITSIGENTFDGCRGLTGISIPDSVTSIGQNAFSGCTNLIKTENGVQYVDKWIINCATSVTQVNLRSNSKGIADSAFYGCDNLTSITIPDRVLAIGDSAFWFCSVLANVTIPNSVVSIGNGAFGWCTGLTSVTIGNGVTSIGDDAFYNCSNLINLTIPDSVIFIGEYSFSGCSGLTSLTIGNSVTTINKYAFRDCSGLTSITIPDSVITIDIVAFAGCTALESLTIGNGVTSIGNGAFENCTALTSITIPASVTFIDGGAFVNCTSLTSITVAEGNTVYHSQGNCIIDTENKALVVGCNNSIIPDDGSVTYIGGQAFSGCNGLTSIIIPEGITTIDSSAFQNCGSLESIILPDSATYIGQGAFAGCSGLTSITLGGDVFYISGNAFNRCGGLTDITFKGTKAQWEAIIKDPGWDDNTGEYTVHCTDGDIEKSAS